MLRVRPWLPADMPHLLAAMAGEYPTWGLWSHPQVDVPGPQRWTGPRTDEEASRWLSGQDRGWRDGDWLVHDLDNPTSCRVAAKSGYPFSELSPASPPYWFTAGHIHLAEAAAR